MVIPVVGPVLPPPGRRNRPRRRCRRRRRPRSCIFAVRTESSADVGAGDIGLRDDRAGRESIGRGGDADLHLAEHVIRDECRWRRRVRVASVVTVRVWEPLANVPLGPEVGRKKTTAAPATGL